MSNRSQGLLFGLLTVPALDERVVSKCTQRSSSHDATHYANRMSTRATKASAGLGVPKAAEKDKAH